MKCRNCAAELEPRAPGKRGPVLCGACLRVATRERQRRFRERHPGYYSRKCRAWREANPDYSALRREKEAHAEEMAR